MSRGLTYADLTVAEQGQYTTLVRQFQAASAEGTRGHPRGHHTPPRLRRAPPTPAPPPAGPRQVWARQRVSASGQRWLARGRRQPPPPTDAAPLAHFICLQAARRGFETFERASFPQFPVEIDPFPAGHGRARPGGARLPRRAPSYCHDL